MFYPHQKFTEANWDDYTLVMPSIAVGNVGQLASDLLISTLEVELIGTIHTPTVLPVVGADPFSERSKQLVTSCQVYEDKKNKLVIMQQRAPVCMNKRKEYRAFFQKWIKLKNFKQVVLLSSCFSHFLTDSELQSLPLHFLCTTAIENDIRRQLEEGMGWKQVPRRDPFSQALSSSGVLTMPGAGMTRSFFEECEMEHIPLVVLLLYCSEGNNIPDAFLLANLFNQFMKVAENPKELSHHPWKIPISWNLPFGTDPPNVLF